MQKIPVEKPVFSDPRFRLPAYRGVLFKMQGYASDTMNHCVRPGIRLNQFLWELSII